MTDGSTRLATITEWSVLFKLEVLRPARHLTDQEPRDLIKKLHPQTTVDGGGKDITIRTWQLASDAGEAGHLVLTRVRAAAEELRLPPLKVIRQHATSPFLRDVSVIRGSGQRLEETDVWGMLANLRLGASSAVPTPQDLDAVRALLPGRNRRVLGSGREIFAQWWVTAADIGTGSEVAAVQLKAAMSERRLGEYELYRLQPCSPGEHFFEVYPGAIDRVIGGVDDE